MCRLFGICNRVCHLILYLLKAAYYSVMTLRTMFDVFSGYMWGKRFGTLDEKKWLSRIIYLETVAGVPGMDHESYHFHVLLMW